jgi:hypothetical protein
MSMTGRTVKEHVSTLVDNLALEKRTAETSLHSAQRQLEQNQGKKADQLAIMAKVHLSAVMGGQDDLRPISSEVTSLLAKRDSDYKQLQTKLETEREALSQADVALRTAQQMVDGRKKDTDAALASNPELKQARDEAARLQAVFDSQSEVLNGIQAEAAGKLKAFLEDPFFNHLQRTGFGTDAPKGRWIFRGLDQWLAKRINYDQAARDYKTLIELPTRAKADYEATAGQLNNAREKSAQIMEGIDKDIGLGQALNRLEAAQQRLQERRTMISTVQDELNRHMAGTDGSLKKISDVITKTMQAMSLPTLDRLTRETENHEDELALSTYRSLVESDERLRNEVANMQNRLESVALRFRRAKSLREYCEDQGFENGSRVFNRGFDLAGLVEGYMLGKIEQSTFGRKIESSSEIERPVYEAPAYTAPTYGSSGSTGSSGFSNSESVSNNSGFGNSETVSNEPTTYRNTDSF